MKINNRVISRETQPYIIAEMSANHNGDINNAFKIINLAKNAGVSAVKLQTYTPDTITMDMRTPEFMIEVAKESIKKGSPVNEKSFLPKDRK